ncbi:MAG: adenine deaminase [Chloroflexi bacterium]|nr:adenine deaminase [Chloroflexota bacterium]
MGLADYIAVAKEEAPADLLLKNARVVNTLSAQVEEADVAIYGGRIVGVGSYSRGRRTMNLKGKYLLPGLIDGHTHVESSLLHVPQYARAVVPHGTVAAVTDLHEMANVAGLEGVRYLMDCARPLPLDLYFMLPSCVPATSLETAGARLSARELRPARRWRRVLGLGEVMNFPGVLTGDADVLAKLDFSQEGVIDGHAPELRGKELNAYLSAGIGSDHECTTYQEAQEKLRRGMYIMIREGSAEKNLEALLPLAQGDAHRRCMLVVDDRSATDLLRDGDMDAVVRRAIRLGLEPIRAIQLATINPAQYFGLRRLGAIAPSYEASVIVVDDLRSFQVEKVFRRGRLVAQEGKALFSPQASVSEEIGHTVRIKAFTVEDLFLPVTRDTWPIIEVVPGQVITKKKVAKAAVQDGRVVSDTERDILKLAVVERHRATGNIGLGLVTGFSLKRGALASSVAHDSHNVVVVGTDDGDMYQAVKEVEERQGGLVAVAGGRLEAALALPVAGILSPEPLEAVVAHLEKLNQAARDMGCSLPAPFDTLSFLALPVIPELRLTDLGLVEVTPGYIARWSWKT